MNDDMSLQGPPVLPPAHLRPESAYGVAHDLLVERAPREALEVLERALALEPANTGLRALRAWALLMRAQLRKAETELRSLVEETPDDVWARFALGRALVRQSRLKDALPHLRMAAVMSGDPEHEVEVLRVERMLAESGRLSWDQLT